MSSRNWASGNFNADAILKKVSDQMNSQVLTKVKDTIAPLVLKLKEELGDGFFIHVDFNGKKFNFEFPDWLTHEQCEKVKEELKQALAPYLTHKD